MQGLKIVTAGQLIEANLDLTLANDITGPVSIAEMQKRPALKMYSTGKKYAS